MGLYDTFIIEANCKECGKILDNWQTKQPDCLLNCWHKGDQFFTSGLKVLDGTVAVYECCSECRTWNNASIIIKDGIVSDIEVQV